MRRRVEAADSPKPKGEFTIAHDPTVEQVILAAALVAEPDVRDKLLARISVDCFFIEEYRAAWGALLEMKHRNLVYDPATLQRLAGDTVRIAHMTELQTLRPEVPTNLEQYIEWIHWDRKRTTVASGSLAGLLEALKDPRSPPERVRALARSIGQAFEGFSDRQHIYDPTHLVAEMMGEIRNRVSGHAVYPFGIDGLDYYEGGARTRRMIPGAAPGLVTIVTGVTGSGKSTLTAHLALGQAAQGRQVLYGAWEVQAPMTLEILTVLRLGLSRTDLLDPSGAFERGRLTHETIVRFEEEAHVIAQRVRFMKNPFRRNRGERMSNDANLDLVQSILADAGCHVFIADLWARCLVSRKPEDEEEALFRQQSMLEEMGIHGILVHQQRYKDIELRADKRPTREGLKGSGAYAETADNLFGTHRPAQWKKVDDVKLEILILKQRYAKWPLGIEFEWDGDKGSILGGRSIEYDPTGGSEEFGLGSTFTAPDGGEGHRNRRGRPRAR